MKKKFKNIIKLHGSRDYFQIRENSFTFEIVPILKIKNDNPEKEFEFELKFQQSLNSQQRFEMMIKRSREIMERLIRNGHRKPFEIIKRK